MEGYRREPVWDPVTRLWHWVLAASVITGWSLGEFRTFSIMQWHIYLGYLTGALLVFRYAWGWAGPAPVRHRTLFASLRGMPAYLRQVGARRPSGVPGHNPVGALSVIAMVLALTAQVVTGLFSEDDALFYSGPLASEVSSDTVVAMTRLSQPVRQGGARARRPARGRHPLLPRVETGKPGRSHAEWPEIGEGASNRGRVGGRFGGRRTAIDALSMLFGLPESPSRP